MDDTTVVTLDELGERLPFEMDDADEREAVNALETLSDDARFYGSDLWETPETTPHYVKNLILKAASRHMKNYDGYTTSRAGDETVGWTDRGHDSGSAYFTKPEQGRLATYANRGGLISAPIQAWGTRSDNPEGFIPVAGSDEKPFPMYQSDESPW